MLLALTIESLTSSPARFRLIVAVTAVVILSVGFVLVHVPRRRPARPTSGEKDPARGLWRFNVVMMWITAAGLAAFLFVPRGGPVPTGRRADVARAVDIAPAVENASVANATRKTFAVKGMTCQGCVQTVTKALLGVSGVLAASVDLEGESAVVSMDPGKAPPDSVLVTAVVEAGYKAWPLESADDDSNPDADGGGE
jgi:copper chaperone